MSTQTEELDRLLKSIEETSFCQGCDYVRSFYDEGLLKKVADAQLVIEDLAQQIRDLFAANTLKWQMGVPKFTLAEEDEKPRILVQDYYGYTKTAYWNKEDEVFEIGLYQHEPEKIRRWILIADIPVVGDGEA